MLINKNRISYCDKYIKELVEVEHTPEKVYVQLDSKKTNKYELKVEIGQVVKKHQLVAVRTYPNFTQNVFSSVSGKVAGVEKRFTNSGKINDCLIIENDFLDTKDERYCEITHDEVMNFTPEQVIQKVEDCSVIGHGGAGFPTFVKLKSKNIHTVVVNGAECEPGLKFDYYNALHHPERIVSGVVLSMNVTGAKKAYICIKNTKQDAIASIEKTINEKFSSYDIKVKPVKDYYPQGWEDEIISSVIGKKFRGLPFEHGFLVLNMTTTKKIYEACRYNVNFHDAIITVIGEMFNKQILVKTLVGTPVSDLVNLAGGYSSDEDKVLVAGGPMTGVSLLLENAIVNDLTLSIQSYKAKKEDPMPCIRCGSCVKNCPVGLAPVLIANQLVVKDVDALNNLKVKSCIECGLCTYVCPSKIHVTEKVRQAKNLVLK